MKLAIHNSKLGFHSRWIKYCDENKISYKLVDCYSNSLINELKDCKALMWHHSQQNPKDLVIAKQILFALEHTGFKVFPNFKTGWHFDDKLGQKYLFERIGLPFVESYAFYDKKEALAWLDITQFPKVFKLRGGAGSSNVKLVHSKNEAIKFVKKAFSSGFSNYDSWGSLKERLYKFKKGKVSIKEPIKGVLRLFNQPLFAKALGVEFHYVYFQEFMPQNLFDIRIIVIGDKAFGLKRYVRDGDFRASGSGNFAFKREEFDERCVQLAFQASEKLKTQCAAYDFVFNQKNQPVFVEISYGFVKEVYDPCPGYWDKDLRWFEEKFNPQGWIVDLVLKSI